MESDFLQSPPEEKISIGSHIVDFIQTLVVFLAIGSFIYWQIAQPHKVSGSSMFPNFHDGDYIITDKLSFKLQQPKRFDVVVFKNPRDKSQDFIKRIIGLPGDKVKIANSGVVLNGSLLGEPYLKSDVRTDPGPFLQEDEEITVPVNSLVVLGDNRSRSSDSRDWGFITKDEVIGKVFFRYWPKDSIGLYPAANY
ncbi:signal peptidase I [Candidatus Daviesbacteria bacterium]|nr:signal peptidase I [Candidatus Daviesbacteria bacterium]